MVNLYNTNCFKVPLSNKEQKSYFQLASQGDEQAKKIILEHNFKLITLVINRHFHDFDEESKKELFSVGCLELWRCIQNFDISLDTKFSTYAIPSITGCIKRYLRDNKQIHIPRKILSLATNILNLENESTHQLSTLELAETLDVSEEEINLAKACNQQPLSLNQPINQPDGNEIFIEEAIADQNFVIYENIEKKELYEDLMKTLNKLPEKQQSAIILLFGLNCEKRKQKDVGEILNLSQSQVSYLKTSALKLLKKHLPKYIKEEYEKKYIISKK